MKLYLAGPMTGIEGHNFPAFFQAARELQAAGHTAINTADFGKGDADWSEYMKRDIPLMMSCQGVATLDGWTNSKGAQLEVHIAKELGMRVDTVSYWVRAVA